MIVAAVMYPQEEGKRFDLEYYLKRHMTRVEELWGPMGMREAHVLKGVAGGEPGQPAPYRVIAQLHFDTIEAFQKAVGAHGEELFGDVPNFTDITPQVQISEIVL
jgi:uncharacterized protein (TIGR02118 family)